MIQNFYASKIEVAKIAFFGILHLVCEKYFFVHIFFIQAFSRVIIYYFCSDGETFISADDLRINLWNLEISNQSFNIVDVKPQNMEDLTGKS